MIPTGVRFRGVLQPSRAAGDRAGALAQHIELLGQAAKPQVEQLQASRDRVLKIILVNLHEFVQKETDQRLWDLDK